MGMGGIPDAKKDGHGIAFESLKWNEAWKRDTKSPLLTDFGALPYCFWVKMSCQNRQCGNQ